jgi:hypothetical protein
MNEKFPIEKAADYSARIQAGLTHTLKYITAEEVYTEFNKRCANGMQYTTFPNEIIDTEIAKLTAKGFVVTKNTVHSKNRDGAPDLYIGFQVALSADAAAGHRPMQISEQETNGFGESPSGN